MSIHLGVVSTYPCFTLYIVSKWYHTNNICLGGLYTHTDRHAHTRTRTQVGECPSLSQCGWESVGHSLSRIGRVRHSPNRLGRVSDTQTRTHTHAHTHTAGEGARARPYHVQMFLHDRRKPPETTYVSWDTHTHTHGLRRRNDGSLLVIGESVHVCRVGVADPGAAAARPGTRVVEWLCAELPDCSSMLES